MLRKAWAVVSANLGVVLLVLGVLLAVVVLVWWLRRRRDSPSVSAAPAMHPNRLLQIRQRFLDGQPWRKRAAVKDLPTVVVLGPSASGKTQLITLELDWERQAHQFLPSYTQDPLLQMYLGADAVAQEVSAQLLEDDSLETRRALQRLWQESFDELQQSLAVITLNTRWLNEAKPDEVRRIAQLVRGKLNLIAEVSKRQVEVRVCLTHMDTVLGFTDFAQLLDKNGAPLHFDIPPAGKEKELVSVLRAQEQYLALGLTTLKVHEFERLQHFFTHSNRSFESLGEFITALREGGTLSLQPSLSRVYLSSKEATARAKGVLTIPPDSSAVYAQRKRYLQGHLQRCLTIVAVCCLPVLAAYANYQRLLREAEQRLQRFNETVDHLREQELEVEGALVESQVREAGKAMDELWTATRYWPPLRYSFTDERDALYLQLAEGIREAHLEPTLKRCHRLLAGQCSSRQGCELPLEQCRPEQLVYLMAALYASKSEELGDFVRSSIHKPHAWLWAEEVREAKQVCASNLKPPRPNQRTWLTAAGLVDHLVEDYVLTSAQPWKSAHSCESRECKASPDKCWSCWPYQKSLTLNEQLTPWKEHFEELDKLLEAQGLQQRLLHAGAEERSRLIERLRAQRQRLLAQLDDSVLFADLRCVLDLLDASRAGITEKNMPGIQSTQELLVWLARHRDTLEAVLRMEQDFLDGIEAVKKLSAAELLTREGLWVASTGNGPFQVPVLQSEYTYRPLELSRTLMGVLIKDYEARGELPFRNEEPLPGSGGDKKKQVEPITDKREFDKQIRSLVDEFTQRLKNAQLLPEEALQREEYVRKRVDEFSQGYREGLFKDVRAYRFSAPSRPDLTDELAKLTQPSSALADMLREVANRASLDPLEGPYYEPTRNAVAPFKPIVQVMTPDPSGNYPGLEPYRTLLAQLYDEINASAKADGGKAEGDKAEGDKANEPEGPPELAELLTPLGKVSLSMLLEQEDSYLRKVDAWLDKQAIIGELRQPFRQPFLAARDLGRTEIERTLARQWSEAWTRMVRPMVERYPFDVQASQEVDPLELQVLRRKDGEFWQHIHRVFSPVCVERGTEWSIRSPLRGRLVLPAKVLPTLSQLSRLAQMLWDEEGKPRPLMLQVMPLPLPAPPVPGSFLTMSSLKCGKTAAYGFNQSPTWQDFPVSWWDQQTASLVLEMRSPERETTQYSWLEKTRSSWSCFRLLEASSVTPDQHRLWRLSGKGAEASRRTLDIRFGVKGEPWAPFREVRP